MLGQHKLFENVCCTGTLLTRKDFAAAAASSNICIALKLWCHQEEAVVEEEERSEEESEEESEDESEVSSHGFVFNWQYLFLDFFMVSCGFYFFLNRVGT